MSKSRRKRAKSNRPSRSPSRVEASTVRDALEPRRFTPPRARPRFRPTWHKIVAAAVIVLGVVLILLNFAEDENLGVLPGGHSPLYFLAGLAIAGSSLWWFGAFDPPM